MVKNERPSFVWPVCHSGQRAKRASALPSRLTERMLTVEQAAELLQAHQQTVRRWLRDGKLKGRMPGGTKLGYRIPESEVTRLLNPDQADQASNDEPAS
jgi:excisionase family DNA binding protein